MVDQSNDREVLKTANLSVFAESREGILITRVVGRLDAQNVHLFRQAITSLPSSDHTACLLDMTDLTYINSDGLRVLLGFRRSLAEDSSQLGLCSLSDSIRAVFEISGFHRVIPIYPDLAAGMRGTPSRNL